tara:strand:+ start:1024 stop:1161 length:138 start_codon:yes stop_codon:yes gene_type:complete
MDLILTEEQIKTLIDLITVEMSGICGDRGYEELSTIKIILETLLD